MSIRPTFSAVFTGSAFVALCAVALAWETSLIARTPAMPMRFYLFVFFATWLAYRVHMIVGGDWRRRTTSTALAVISGGLALTLPSAMWPWLGVAAVLAGVYSLPALPGRRRLREFGIAKILSLAGVWMLVTAYLPVQGHDLRPDVLAFLLVRRFLFVFALCVAFDLRDRKADATAGIRTVAVRLGTDRAFVLMRGTLLLFAGLIVLTPLTFDHPEAHGMTLALLASALVTWIALECSRRFEAHRLYHLSCVDGMMVVQALLVAIATLLPAHA